jgi:cyanophycin synthetase
VLPFEDSRRLTGPNFFFDGTGAALEVIGVAVDDALLEGWRVRSERALRLLGWASAAAPASLCGRVHASGASLAVAAPCDQLFAATEVNEWALCATLFALDPTRWANLETELRDSAATAQPAPLLPPVIDEAAALQRFRQLADTEARPALHRVLEAATARGLMQLLDDETLTLGGAAGGRSWPLAGLPAVDEIPWSTLRNVPTALVTGSNGKTTTTRLIAACATAHGWTSGYSCTDGLFVGGATVDSGDYSGPVGARNILRDSRVEAAVLETARGGILRRGLAVTRADVAVVTNVSSDHFGEYGIHDLDALADAKLTVAAAVGPTGRLVLNADDSLLREKATRLRERFGRELPLAWFAEDADLPLLVAHRAAGGSTCGLRDGRLLLQVGSLDHDLGGLTELPLALDGAARHNVANLAAAALAAAALGIPAGTIGAAFARFGTAVSDNPGRLMRFWWRGVQVLVDYAHNPEGLRAILEVAQRLRGPGRVGMLLGHAGNRQDAALAQVAAVAAEFKPDLVVVKEIETYLRGRAPGEVPCILSAELLRLGLPESAVALRMSEFDAARCALDWAQPGDVLVLLVHSLAARSAVLELLQEPGPAQR